MIINPWSRCHFSSHLSSIRMTHRSHHIRLVRQLCERVHTASELINCTNTNSIHMAYWDKGYSREQNYSRKNSSWKNLFWGKGREKHQKWRVIYTPTKLFNVQRLLFGLWSNPAYLVVIIDSIFWDTKSAVKNSHKNSLLKVRKLA